MIVTIDGPTASGKSTVGRLLAKELGAYYLYTGLLYRALAYQLLKNGYTLATIASPDLDLVKQILDTQKFEYRYDPENQERIFFNKEDITPQLKDKSMDQAASILSTNQQVRELLNSLQREIAKKNSIVIDGRDSGSIVFPHADYKFFLTASDQVRAERWLAMQKERGNNMPFDQALAYIQERDKRDASREHAPLCVPKEARVVDCTKLNVASVVLKIYSEIIF